MGQKVEPISEDEYARWITPAEAVRALVTIYDGMAAMRAIVRRLKTGHIHAAARTIITQERTLHFHGVPLEAFRDWNFGDAPDFWNGPGDLILYESGDAGYDRTEVDDPQINQVRLNPDHVLALLPPERKAAEASEPPKEQANRGRPRWAHWDDLWAEIAAQLATGKLSASKQADVERAMLEIAEQLPDAPNESTIRIRARKLWETLRREAEK